MVPATPLRKRMFTLYISVPVLLSLHAHLYFERGVHLLPLLPLLIPHPGLITRLVDISCTTADHHFFGLRGLTG